MIDPVYALLRHALDNDVYLQYMDDPKEYHANRKAQAGFYDRLAQLLEQPARQLLDDFLGEKALADVAEEESVFTAGLAFGLQLSRLL